MLNDFLQMTRNASEHGSQIDYFLEAAHWFMLILFVGWSIFFFYTLWKFWHRRHPKARYGGLQSHASSHAEIGVIIVEAVLLLGFAFPLWAKRVNDIPPEGENVLRVMVERSAMRVLKLWVLLPSGSVRFWHFSRALLERLEGATGSRVSLAA